MPLTRLLKLTLNYLYHVFLPSATQMCLNIDITKCMKCFTILSLLNKIFPSHCFSKEEGRNLTRSNDTHGMVAQEILCYCYWLWLVWLSKYSELLDVSCRTGTPRAKVNFLPHHSAIKSLFLPLSTELRSPALTLSLGQEWKWLLVSSHLRCGKIL